MKCELCEKDESYWDLHPVKVRPTGHINERALVCWKCLEKHDLNVVKKKLIRRGK